MKTSILNGVHGPLRLRTVSTQLDVDEAGTQRDLAPTG